MTTTYQIGQRIKSTDGEQGTVTEAYGPDATNPMASDPTTVYVAWESGVCTWTPIEQIAPEAGRTIQSAHDVADIAESILAAMHRLPRRTDLLSGRPLTEIETRSDALRTALGDAYHAAIALANSAEWQYEDPTDLGRDIG